MKILLKNAKIYGGDTADILVEDGTITGIGSFDTADEVHDMTGYASVLPGIIDAHIHIVTGDIEYNDRALRSWAQAGVTTVRDLGIGNDKNQHPTEEFLAYRATIETPECAHCLTCGRFVAEYHGLNHIMSDGAETGYGCKTPEDAAAAVNELIDMGCDGIKTSVGQGMDGTGSVLSVEKLKAIADTAKARGVWCTAHVLDSELVPRLLDAGIPEFAHMPTDHMPDDLLKRMVDQGVTCTPTLCTIKAPRPPMPEGAKLPPMPKDMKMPPMPMIDPDEQEKTVVDNTRRFIEYGGMVAVGTDTMRMESQPHVATMPLRELQLLHQAGLSVSQVIDAATINAAKLCKIDDQVGSIAVGKKANIIAVKAPIDETFEALSHVEFVMNRGTVIKQP
jgi:imidazolonepropionase-like amidohydrolase